MLFIEEVQTTTHELKELSS